MAFPERSGTVGGPVRPQVRVQQVSNEIQGRSSLNLDQKGRMAVPARYRDMLLVRYEGKLDVTQHPKDDCLVLYPRPIWELRRAEIAALPMDYRELQRRMLGSAHDVEMDGAGRILIPQELRAMADLETGVVLLGMGRFFEIWDARKMQEQDGEDSAPPSIPPNFSL